MDTIYQALKNLVKAFVNLFAAVIELFSGLINSLTLLLTNICPRTGKGIIKDRTIDKKKADTDAELICQIRRDLEEKITDRDAYILLMAETVMFENSFLKKAFAGKKRKMTNAIIKALLEEEFKDIFLKDEGKEETPLPAICEVSKEAIS